MSDRGNGAARPWSSVTVVIAAAALTCSLFLLQGQTNARIDDTRAELLGEIRAVRAEIRELRF